MQRVRHYSFSGASHNSAAIMLEQMSTGWAVELGTTMPVSPGSNEAVLSAQRAPLANQNLF